MYSGSELTIAATQESLGQRLCDGDNEPFVFTCTDLWRNPEPLLDFMVGRYGDAQLDSLGGSYGWSVRYRQIEDYDELNVSTVAEYVQEFRNGKLQLPYLRHISINRGMPDLAQWLQMPSEFRPNWAEHRLLDRLSGPELFIGQAGTTFGHLHQDHLQVHVGFVQLEGVKEFLLLPPADGRYLYRIPGRQFPYQLRNSRVRFVDFHDVEQFPLLVQCQPKRIVLRAGQALFLPANWWHTTFNHTDSVSFSIRIVDHKNFAGTIGSLLAGIPRLVARQLHKQAQVRRNE